jgi:hypothetical protein
MAFSFLNDLDMDDSHPIGGQQQPQQQYYQPQPQQQMMMVAPQQPLTSYANPSAAAVSYGSSSAANSNSNQPSPLEIFLMETKKILQSNYTQCARIEYEHKKQKELNDRLEKRLQTMFYILIALFIICFIMGILLCWTCYQANRVASASASSLSHYNNHPLHHPHHAAVAGAAPLPGYSRSWTTGAATTY